MSVARLASGVSPEEASRSTDRIAAQLAELYPDTNVDWKINLLPVAYARFWPGHRGAIVPFLSLAFALAGIVLIVACLNSAGLLLARSTERRAELALRQALGASRIRLIRQLMVEALVLVACAAAIGIWITTGARSLLTLFPRPFMIPFDVDAQIDTRVLLFTILLSLGSVLLFALAPAWQATRFTPFDLRRWQTQGRRWTSVNLRQIALVGQVALSLLLMVAAGLFSRSLNRMTDVDLGFDPQNVLLVTIDPRGILEGSSGWSWDEAADEIRSLPGVSAVGLSNGPPLGSGVGNRDVVAAGYDITAPLSVNGRFVSRDYLETLRVPLRGSDFRGNESDRGTVIINQVMADTIWPNEDAVGRLLRFVGEDNYIQVVAVSGDPSCGSVLDDPSPCLYEPWNGTLFSTAVLTIRSESVPADIIPPVRERLRQLSADVAIYDARTMDAHLAERLSGPRLTAFLSSTLSVTTLVLLAVGVFALISTTVNQSMREIGIRMAVGAEPRQVLVPLVGEMFVWISLGVALGLALSAATSGYVASQLFGISATDPVTFLVAVAALALVAAVALYVPARRATRVDPMVALRHE